MAVALAPQEAEEVTVVLRHYEESQKSHGAFVRHYEAGERAYRGVLAVNSDAAKWRHKYHPPYAFNLLETIVGNQVEPGLPMDVKPAPKIGMNSHDAQDLLDQVQTINDLLRHEYDVDDMDLK